MAFKHNYIIIFFFCNVVINGQFSMDKEFDSVLLYTTSRPFKELAADICSRVCKVICYDLVISGIISGELPGSHLSSIIT